MVWGLRCVGAGRAAGLVLLLSGLVALALYLLYSRNLVPASVSRGGPSVRVCVCVCVRALMWGFTVLRNLVPASVSRGGPSVRVCVCVRARGRSGTPLRAPWNSGSGRVRRGPSSPEF